MRSALERRQTMLELLLERRFMTIGALMNALEVSRSTIIRDIEVLSISMNVKVIRGRSGGVQVDKHYYPTRRFLKPEQEDVLRRICTDLQGEDLKIVQSILECFSKPSAVALK